MKKIIFLSIACFLMARENPFVPAGDLNTDVVVTNLKQEFKPFSQLKIELDKSDMLIDEVVLYTVQKDGSKRKQSIKVGQSIDPNVEYVLTDIKNTICKSCQTPVALNPEVVNLIPKNPEPKEIKKDNQQSISDKTVIENSKESDKTLKNEPQETKKPEKDIKDSFKFKNLVRFEVSDGLIKIYTSAKLSKDFVYKKEKIVLDFNAKFRQFLTFSKRLKTAGFDVINIGAHSGYFRIVIVPKKFEGYVLRPIKGGYELEI